MNYFKHETQKSVIQENYNTTQHKKCDFFLYKIRQDIIILKKWYQR